MMCFLSDAFRVKLPLHVSHEKGLDFSWTALMCAVQCVFCRNRRSHTGHWKFRFFSCTVRTWRDRSAALPKAELHTLHTCRPLGGSPTPIEPTPPSASGRLSSDVVGDPTPAPTCPASGPLIMNRISHLPFDEPDASADAATRSVSASNSFTTSISGFSSELRSSGVIGDPITPRPTTAAMASSPLTSGVAGKVARRARSNRPRNRPASEVADCSTQLVPPTRSTPIHAVSRPLRSRDP
mmetsp:Transcript_30882/g.75481  ORF Transcript_30882/g.75481 Transcript_30882/m.75481 type:complete len:239 (-) Transcript_30882:624-1340(-)